jgi:hypothetical protein
VISCRISIFCTKFHLKSTFPHLFYFELHNDRRQFASINITSPIYQSWRTICGPHTIELSNLYFDICQSRYHFHPCFSRSWWLFFIYLGDIKRLFPISAEIGNLYGITRRMEIGNWILYIFASTLLFRQEITKIGELARNDGVWSDRTSTKIRMAYESMHNIRRSIERNRFKGRIIPLRTSEI